MMIYTYDIILLVAGTYCCKLTLSLQLVSKNLLSNVFKTVDNEKKNNYNSKSHHLMAKQIGL
jgi:hypothetical protein